MPGNMQITGIASGLDVNSIVEQLMEIERQPLYRLVEDRNEMELKKELYSDINAQVYDFQSKMFDLTLESTFKSKKTVVSDESVLTATAGVNAMNSSFTFRNIQLATATLVNSSDEINTSSVLSSTATVGGLDITKSFEDAGFLDMPKGSVTINGVNFDLSKFSSVESFMQAVEDHANADVADFSYNVGADKFSITADAGKSLAMFETTPYSSDSGFLSAANIPFVDSSAKLKDINADISITSGMFSINGVDFSINTEIDSLDNIIKRINQSDAGVTAFYDEVTERLTFTSQDEGNEAIILEDKSSNFLESMKVLNATQDIGQNASFEFNGVATTRNSNTFKINGVTFNLKKDEPGPVNVDISTDTTNISEKMETFVEDYNEIMTMLYSRLNEKKVSSSALNSAQTEEELRELQKQGLLKRDSTLRNIQDRMKSFFATSFAGYTMEDIGIKGAGASGVVSTEMKMGLIEFDKEKFESAMQDMPEIVEAMFRNDGITHKIKNDVIAKADGNKTKFSLGYRNISQEVKVSIGSTDYKMVTNPTAADEFSVDRDTGYITFAVPPAANSDIVATFEAYEGEEFSETQKNIGSGNGYRTTFNLGGRNIGQNVSVIVGDGSTMYSQVATTDELSGNTYYIDREKGKIIFADPVAAGDDVKVSYDYTVSQPGMFNYIYEELKTYTGIGILYQQTNSLSSEVKTIEDNISNLNNRLKNKEERLWKQYTSLETTMNDLNSQSSWLSSQLAQLM